MKNLSASIKLFLSLLCIFSFTTGANGQILKKIAKRAEKAAERTVERRVEKEASKKTDQALDSILEPGKKGKQKKSPVPNEKKPNTNQTESGSDSDTNPQESEPSVSVDSGKSKSIQVYSKFDFVPGDKLLFFDDFKNDFIGDFPSKWNTNGSGEVVTLNESSERWFEFLPGYLYYIPDVPKLPEEYTIEFDLMAVGIDKKTSSTGRLVITLSDHTTFNKGDNYVQASIPFAQYTAPSIIMENRIQKKIEIRSNITADLRDEVMNRPHISIAVNKQRYRLWINQKKYVDIPRMAPVGAVLSTLKFRLSNFRDKEERLFITNLKVAEGGVDLRRKLISEGKVSTNGILFDSGSANIQPQSMGIIRQISQVLQQEASIKLKIVGHTDSDGTGATNMTLSKKRAEAVRNTLINIYNAAPERLTADGKGESEPVGDNSTVDGKAQNRRVVFIKQ